MKRILIAASAALMLIALLAGCSVGNHTTAYEQISPARTKALMDSEEGYVILDVLRISKSLAVSMIGNTVL